MQLGGKGPRMVHSSTPEREASGLQHKLQAQIKGRQVVVLVVDHLKGTKQLRRYSAQTLSKSTEGGSCWSMA